MFNNLTVLRVSSNQITPLGLLPLLLSSNPSLNPNNNPNPNLYSKNINLTILNICTLNYNTADNNLGNTGAILISKANFPNLTILYLSNLSLNVNNI